MLNDRVPSFFEGHEIRISRARTDRGTEYCGQRTSMPGCATTTPVRTHQGRWRCGKTPMQTLIDTPPIAREALPQSRVIGHIMPSGTHHDGNDLTVR